jgi:hypothetical protein
VDELLSLPDAAPELIERGAPRTNQAVAAAAVFAAWLADMPAIVLVVAVVLWVGSAFGRRFVPAYVLYFSVVRPLLVKSGGKPWVEDERMPRFAQAMGGTVFLCAYAAMDAGAPAIGWGIALSLAAAAALASATGICLGCLTYRMLAKLRGVTPSRLEQIDLTEVRLPQVGPDGRAVVAFQHPLCSDCQVWEQRLSEGDTPYATVNVEAEPRVAARHGITLVPSIFEVAGDGRVLRQLAP